MDSVQLVGSMLAGLGLFFVGINTLTSNLRQLTGRRFRMFIERSTRSPFVSAGAGAALGATLQTGSAITFILVGMVNAGMITVDRSLPVRLGAAVGTSTMVFVATLDIQTLILFLVGIGGVAMTQSRSPRPVLGMLFGGGLMFFGLKMVGSASSSLTELAWFFNAIASINEVHLEAFALGVLLSVALQSPQSVAILAIAMTSADVISTWTTIAIIYGSNFGGGLSTYFLSSAFRGTSRQIMIFQVTFNILTGIILLALFFFEKTGGIPLVHALVTSIAVDIEKQMAIVYLIFNVFGSIIMFVLRKPILSSIERRWPPSPEESLARPKFLNDYALETPDLALDLIREEEKRFFGLLTKYIEGMRLPSNTTDRQTDTVSAALDSLHDAIEQALAELGHKSLGIEGSEQLIKLTNRNRLLGTLHASFRDLEFAVVAAKKSPNLILLAETVVEAMDALLGAAIDAVQNDDQDDLEILWNATQDRSDQMRMTRRRIMQSNTALSEQDRFDLMGLTNGLERSIWVLHQLISDLRVGDRAASAAKSA